ncbi:MAG: sodium:solute symporter [Halodesulfovibrio sp.]|uniref:sodium:solute symporter family protein n=1 Tax=Halodesulfovibrio sp. TaxID=1912772 RepID=UPI00359E62E6
MAVKLITSLLYFGIVFYLGWKGWKETKNAGDYMLAGRSVNPFVMAMSYGATFISTSAIIGFGGVAAMFGMSLLWLAFLNIFVGIFIAMVFLGKRTRRMGLVLNCHTFPELLGKRYHSKFIQGFSGGIIFFFIPVYAAAVLTGICRMTEVSLGLPYEWMLIGITAILSLYVITGGMKAVMYTDAFQGTIMVGMMVFLLGYTYYMLGGVVPAHEALTSMANLVPESLQKGGIIGWTQGTETGSPLWLVIYTTIVYGVGIGVLAQPQLAVRFMTVSSDKELNRAVLYGSIFILLTIGVVYVVGALSNAIFFNQFGKISIHMAGGNLDKIVPIFIEKVMPPWFSAMFLLAMFAAAMSTLSSQFHIGGTSLAHDVSRNIMRSKNKLSASSISQLGIVATIIATLVWAWLLPPSIVARATAFFFGLSGATFLPAYVFGLYWKGMTKTGAKVSIVGGFTVSMLWMLFIHKKEAAAIGLCETLFGKVTLVADAAPGSTMFLLQWVDPNVVALPISIALAVGVSLVSRSLAKEHIQLCWQNCS